MSEPEAQPIDLGPSVEGLRVGRTLFNRYRLERELGRGGMGVVWLAFDTEVAEHVALKFLPEILAGDEEALESLRTEVRKTRSITHRNIIRVHDLVRDDSVAAISMEYVGGGTLRDLRRKQPRGVFTVEDLMPWLEQLCAGLDDAHRFARVVHRDLKPVNLMVTTDGLLKIADFGLARSLTESSALFSGKIAGTPGFMSPQQARGEVPRPTDDLYAVGATLYDLLTGKPPFFRGDVSVIIDQVKHVDAPSIAQRRQELEIDAAPVPPHWEETIAACLSKEPANRPQSGADILCRLKVASAAPASTRSSTEVDDAADTPTIAVDSTAASDTEALTAMLATPAPSPIVPPPPGAPVAVLSSALSRINPFLRRRSVLLGIAGLVAIGGMMTAAFLIRNLFQDKVSAATIQKPFVNSLGMRFVPVEIVSGPTAGKRVLFSVYETRVQDYKPFTEATNRQIEAPRFARGEDHPIVNVSWEDASNWCAWLSAQEKRLYRLPTDHEWSCAVGIGRQENPKLSPTQNSSRLQTIYPWGSQWPPPPGAANLYDLSTKGSNAIKGYEDGFPHTSPVGRFAANRLGLHDLGGNVSEWCEDEDGKDRRVIRGPTWDTSYSHSSAERSTDSPKSRLPTRGFRCVLVADEGTK